MNCSCFPKQDLPHVVRSAPTNGIQFFGLVSLWWEAGQRMTCERILLPKRFKLLFVKEPLWGQLKTGIKIYAKH